MYVLTHKTCYLIQIVDIYLTTISLYIYVLILILILYTNLNDINDIYECYVFLDE